MVTRKLMYFALIALLSAAGAVQAGGDSARGAQLAADCADCHGNDGMGDGDTIPHIAGLDEAGFVQKLAGFKSGEIPDPDGMMADYVADLSEQDMADLAAYYSKMKQ